MPINHPADLTFIIDRTLELGEGERPFNGTIDPRRIGAFGISLGANTVTRVATNLTSGLLRVLGNPDKLRESRSVCNGVCFSAGYFVIYEFRECLPKA